MMTKNIIFLSLILSTFLTVIPISSASNCSPKTCAGYNVPEVVRIIINKGCDEIPTKIIQGNRYFTVTSTHDTNKCSVFFKINEQKVEPNPSVGINEQICNITIHDGKVLSALRDTGKWNDGAYQVNDDGKWMLLFRDSCVDCD